MAFIKILVFSNEEYENVTIPANNMVLSKKLRTSERKNPQNLSKDRYMKEPVKYYIVINLFLFFPDFFL